MQVSNTDVGGISLLPCVLGLEMSEHINKQVALKLNTALFWQPQAAILG